MAAKSTMKVENWPIDKLKPYGRNPRKNDSAVDSAGVIVAGHTIQRQT